MDTIPNETIPFHIDLGMATKFTSLAATFRRQLAGGGQAAPFQVFHIGNAPSVSCRRLGS
jgi:hypothetical protein